jgi:flagellar protein FliO/FliZ
MTKLNLLHKAVVAALTTLSACALALAFPGVVLAAKGTGTGENTPLNLGSSSSAVHSSSGGASIVRTIVGLAIVIAVIVGLAWILRQVKAGRDPHVSSAGLQSVAALTLGSGRSLHLVRAGSEYVLLASAEHAMVPIHRYSEQEARDAGLPTDDELAEPPARTPLLGSTRSAAELVDRLREWTVRR